MSRTRYEMFTSEDVPKVVCYCGRTLELWDSMTNTCDCGQEFNGSGQALAPRHQWGAETGEHPADVARISDFNSREDFGDEY